MNSDTIRPGNRAPDSLIGTTIDDKYRIESKLGEGGMGTVYLAARLMIGDTVAIKVLHVERVSDSQAVERFRREAQAAARLKHPNAVNIYDFGVSNSGLVYLVMELVEGESLRSLIKQQGPLTPTAASEILRQICAALDEAHRQHIVHRDLKPDNIIVTTVSGGLRVKVLDFGIAKMRDLATAADNLTQTGTVMGTPHYMSPEQCLGEELDGRSDIYSTGIMLYEMLAGMVPFNSPASTAVVVQHVTQPPPPLRAINASISPEVEAVVRHALEKPREARPQTAGLFAQEMIAALSGVGSVQPVTTGAVDSNPSRTIAASGTLAAGMAPTMQMRTPTFSGAVTPAGVEAVPGSAPPGRARSKTALMIAGAVILAAVAATVAILVTKTADKNSGVTPNPPGEKDAKRTREPAPPAGMTYVAGGEFLMGNDDGALLERPMHKETVKPFFIDVHEVTCEEYEKFSRATGRQPPESWTDGRYPPGAARRPVTGINWDDASEYAKWAGKRLPSEREWELAARGKEGLKYPWGNEWKPGFANADSTAIGRMSEVGAYSAGASPFGALDMVGNAWEWTSSDLVAYPGGQLPPQTGVDLKVLRGGCWKSDMNKATATFRMGWPARGDTVPYDETGIRCAKDAPASSQ
ncbi:MAG: SUMF1/EgtB/PvdO family nonheme iron enzyme [Acidobacteriota bacterium]